MKLFTRMMIGVVAAAVLCLVCNVAPAQAVNAPNWVAVLYIEAQKAVGLRWMPVAGASGYKILRSTTQGQGYAEIASTAAPQHFDKSVEPGDTYYYVLQAIAGAEASPVSGEKSVSIPGQKKVQLGPPELEKVTLQSTTEFGKVSFKVGLFWNVPGPVIAYNVYRSTKAGERGALLTSTQDVKAIDDKVEVNKTYYYTVTALDESFQETPPSQEKSIQIEPPKKDDKPKRKKLVALDLVMKSVKQLPTIRGGDDGTLTSPVDSVVSSSGDVYVLSSPGFVTVFNAGGEVKNQFGENGPGANQMLKGYGMGIGSDDTIYVADTRKVLVYSPDGILKTTISVPQPDPEYVKEAEMAMGVGGLTPGPVDVTETADGNLAVVDNAFSRVVILDKEGTFISDFGKYGSEEGSLKRPTMIAINSKGEILVNDNMNRRAQIFAPDYQFKAVVGESKNMVGAFLGLYGAAVDESDNFLVSDPPMTTVQVFSSEDGTYLYHFANEKKEVDEGSKGQRPLMPITNPAGISYSIASKTIYIPLTQENSLAIWQVIE